MTVNEVMSKPAARCASQTNAAEACSLMWENNCRALPVLSADGQVEGIVTDRDIFIALGTRNRLPSELSIGEVLYRPATLCRPSDNVSSVWEQMRADNVRESAVIGVDGQLEGMISAEDCQAWVALAGPRMHEEEVTTA